MQKYINYENVICCSTYTNKPKILFSKQNQAIKIIPMTDMNANLNSEKN